MKIAILTTQLFYPLRSTGPHSSLGISPNELDMLAVAIVICLFIARTIKHACGLGTSFKSTNKETTTFSTNQTHQELYALPDISLSMPLRLSTKDKRVFAKAVELQHTSTINAKVNIAELCLYLAALTEPAMLLMLAKRGCPIRPLGAVNVRNRFEILDQETCKALFTNSFDASTANGLSVLARFPRPARRIRRGIEVDIEVSIVADQSSIAGVKPSTEVKPENQAAPNAIFRQEFTMLQFMKFRGQQSTFPSNRTEQLHDHTSSKDLDSNHSIVTTVTMKRSDPRIWAQLCKDYNPIHFSPYLAKLLGQRGQLAHGNHAVGIIVQALYRPICDSLELKAEHLDSAKQIDDPWRALQDRMEHKIHGDEVWWMEIRFRRPTVLPAQIGARLNSAADGFEVVDGRTGKTNIVVNMGVT